jgi:hypothetical protein
LYVGEYHVPTFTGEVLSNGGYTALDTTGCFEMILEQPVGGVAGQIHYHRLPAAVVSPTPNAEGFGEPNQSGDFAETELDTGSIETFSITNLTTTSGTGAFTLSNSIAGTLNITGSETVVESGSIRRSQPLGHSRLALRFKAWRDAHLRR